MKGLIYRIKDRLTGVAKLPVSVTAAIYEGNQTQETINVSLRNQIASLRKTNVNQQFFLFNQANHRGGVSYPENTIPAYEHAISVGFTFCETDVRVTKDGKFVALHDETINRTSTGTGNVANLTYSQLQSYDFGSWKGSQFTGTKIPLISEIALLCKRNKVMLELDCAGRLTETQMCALYDELKQIGVLNCVDICGYPSELQWLYDSQRTDVSVSVSFLNTTPTPTVVAGLPSFINAFAGVNVSIKKDYITTSIIAAVRNRGWNVKSWTISNSTELNTYANMGVDTVLVDSDTKY